jgi:hypothetical protein
MMIVQDVEVQKKEERLLLGDVDYLVIGEDTDQDRGLHSGLIQWSFSGVQAGGYLQLMVEGPDQDLTRHDPALHPVVLLREVPHLLRTKNHLGIHPRLFPVPWRKGQDVGIMTKKGFVSKAINASLITETTQLC